MNCISEPIKYSIIEYGLPIVLLGLLGVGITYFLCKNYDLIKQESIK